MKLQEAVDRQSIYRQGICLLKEAAAFSELDAQQDLIISIIPQCSRMIGYDQNHPNHPYDLWGHCLYTVLELPRKLPDDMLYLAALLHDIAKPDCRQEIKPGDNLGKMYHGHPKLSAQFVEKNVLPVLEQQNICLSEEEQRRLIFYIAHHDDHIDVEFSDAIKKAKEMNPELCKNLMYLEIADAKAHRQVPVMTKRIQVCQKILDAID